MVESGTTILYNLVADYISSMNQSSSCAFELRILPLNVGVVQGDDSNFDEILKDVGILVS